MICAVSVSHAANRTWQDGDPLGGNFSDETRWAAPSAPGVNDTVTFNGGSYPENSEFTVTLTENVTNQWLRVSGNRAVHVTLNLNGYTYSTTSTDNSHTYFQGEDATLTFTGGTANLPVFSIGRSAGSLGKLILTGSGTTLNATTESYIANAGTGSLEITDGAKLNTTAIVRIAHGANANGSLLIEGSGSALNATGAAVIIAGNGTASLEIKDGGQLVASGGSGNIRFAQTGDSTSIGLITGQNSKLEGSGISIGGADTAKGGVAQVYVRDSASMIARGTLRVFEGSLLEVEDAQVVSSHFTGDLNSTLSLVITEPLAVEQALITVTNNVALDNMELILDLASGTTFAANEVIHLVNYGGILTGQFLNMDDGDLLNVGGYDFLLSYGSGEASSISLTVVPEPGTVVLIVGGSLLLTIFGKRKKQFTAK